jgi:hypothetical protein
VPRQAETGSIFPSRPTAISQFGHRLWGRGGPRSPTRQPVLNLNSGLRPGNPGTPCYCSARAPLDLADPLRLGPAFAWRIRLESGQQLADQLGALIGRQSEGLLKQPIRSARHGAILLPYAAGEKRCQLWQASAIDKSDGIRVHGGQETVKTGRRRSRPKTCSVFRAGSTALVNERKATSTAALMSTLASPPPPSPARSPCPSRGTSWSRS